LRVSGRKAGSFSLDFPSGSAPNLTDDFVLSCRLLVSDDPCEAQAAAVKEFQEAIANIEGRAKQLNSGHGGEPPAQVQAELDQLASEMLMERAKLEDAEIALEKCRKWNVTPVGLTSGPPAAHHRQPGWPLARNTPEEPIQGRVAGQPGLRRRSRVAAAPSAGAGRRSSGR